MGPHICISALCFPPSRGVPAQVSTDRAPATKRPTGLNQGLNSLSNRQSGHKLDTKRLNLADVTMNDNDLAAVGGEYVILHLIEDFT